MTDVAKGLTFQRYFTKDGVHPFDEVEWEMRTAKIEGESGTVFEQQGVEVPKSWSQLATNIVASKYFRGQLGTPTREYSVRQLISRVVDTIVKWGKEGTYFAGEQDAVIFGEELKYLAVNQMMLWNSPVLFNLGWPGRQQSSSACYITACEDNMASILDLYKIEGMLFKAGAGAGSSLSTIRSSKESLSAGGKGSGPVAFMKGLDASGGSLKSGGTTRRAAILRCLNIDHPDIREFINCKPDAEKKAHALINAGFDSAFNVPYSAYDSVHFQNANISVRVTDAFMEAVIKDQDWHLKAVTTGEILETVKARVLFREIAEAAHFCADPGLQFHDTINKWNGVKNSGEFRSSNPCSEFHMLDWTSCNLASLNLLKFLDEKNDFNSDAFITACALTAISQEITISGAEFPTERITEMSRQYRPIGLGYANLGALLMAKGLAYDSHEGRTFAETITAILTGSAFYQSARIAKVCGGPFAAYVHNKDPMMEKVEGYKDFAKKLSETKLDVVAKGIWTAASALGSLYGFRNCEVSCAAPTGTISLAMDCSTSGIEPAFALVAYKKLVGGGTFKMVNDTVERGLHSLGYDGLSIQNIKEYIDAHDTVEGCVSFNREHLPVFDCAIPAGRGTRSISPEGHLMMNAAVQRFFSMGTSKTINCPNSYTVEDIMNIYTEAWKMGIKSISIYRDGCKLSQPLNTKKTTDVALAPVLEPEKTTPQRRRLPNDRKALTHKFDIAGHEGYIHLGFYDDGTPGEMFVKMAKEGSTVSGLMDTVATLASMALQYGVPVQTLVDKFSHTRYEPSGFTGYAPIPYAKSLTDYLFRFLGEKCLAPNTEEIEPVKQEMFATKQVASDGPICSQCGSVMRRRAGSCWLCECGTTSGGCA